MRSHFLSMSRMSLARLCSWSFRPDAPQHPRPAGAPARIGTGTHLLMKAYVDSGTVLADLPGMAPEEAAESLAFFSAPVRAFLDSMPWTACEIGLRYDARTDSATLGPRRGEPGYDDFDAMVLPGTLDLVSVEPDCVTIPDLKTGKIVADKEQLYAQAVAAARFYDKPRARVAYVYARKTKCAPPEWETLDVDALDEQAGRISRVLRRLPVSKPVAGDYCWKCDSRPSCPEFEAKRETDSERELESAGFFT